MVRPVAEGEERAAASEAADRRRLPRMNVIEAQLVTVDLDQDKGALLLDASEDGMALQAVHWAQQGATVSVAFELPESHERLQATATVVWSDRGGRLGVRFCDLAASVRARLQKWLSSGTLLPAVLAPPPAVLASPPAPQPAAAQPRKLDTLAQEITDLETGLALSLIAEQTRAMTGGTGLAIALNNGTAFVCRATSGRAPDVGAGLELTDGLAAACVRSGDMVRCDDINADSRAGLDVARSLGARSAVALPLKGKAGWVGLVEAFSDQPHAFDNAAVRLLQEAGELIVRLAGRQAPPATEKVSAAPAARAAAVPGPEGPLAAVEMVETKAAEAAAPGPVPVARSSAAEPSEAAQAAQPLPRQVSLRAPAAPPAVPPQSASQSAGVPPVAAAPPPPRIPPLSELEAAPAPMTSVPATPAAGGSAAAPPPAPPAHPAQPVPAQKPVAVSLSVPVSPSTVPLPPKATLAPTTKGEPAGTRAAGPATSSDMVSTPLPSSRLTPPEPKVIEPPAAKTRPEAAPKATEPMRYPERNLAVPPTLMAAAKAPKRSPVMDIALATALCAALGVGAWVLYREWQSSATGGVTSSAQEPAAIKPPQPPAQSSRAPGGTKPATARPQIASPPPVTEKAAAKAARPTEPLRRAPAAPSPTGREPVAAQESRQTYVAPSLPPQAPPSNAMGTSVLPRAEVPAMATAPSALPPGTPPAAAPERIITVPPAKPSPPVSQGVTGGKLVHRIEPRYPSLGRTLRLRGVVKLRATVTREGTISKVTVVQGDPILAREAVQAVRQWRYEPYLLNGRPVEMEVDISVNFTLGQ
jgi:protein TonB